MQLVRALFLTSGLALVLGAAGLAQERKGSDDEFDAKRKAELKERGLKFRKFADEKGRVAEKEEPRPGDRPGTPDRPGRGFDKDRPGRGIDKDRPGAPDRPGRPERGVERDRRGPPDRPEPPFPPGPPGERRPGFGRGGPPGEEMREHDPEMAELAEAEHKLEAECHEVAERLRRTRPDSAERGEIKGRLVDLVKKHFEIRQARRKVELKRLEEHLQRLRQSIEQREANRESLVNRRMAELVGEKEDVGF